MESKIAGALQLKHSPVALLWADEKPEGALEFQKGKWGCVMFMFAGAVKGKTAAFGRETFGCWGGGVGLGFGNRYEEFPGGVDCFARFLSTGNAGWERGEQVAEQLKPVVRKEFLHEFLEGERYLRSPELVERFVEELPITDVPAEYVLFKPLKDVDAEAENVVVATFPVNADQLSALVVLANYARPGIENVSVPFGAGCQTIGVLPYREARSERPRAVVGLTDLSARKYARKLLGKDLLTFSMPWKLFLDMEEQVEGSFLQRDTWKSLLETA